MTSKQRAYLKGLAMTMDPILQLGKGGLTPENTAAVDEALAARELIKISVLQNCLEDPRQMAEVLAERTRYQIVQDIDCTYMKKKKIKPIRQKRIKKNRITQKIIRSFLWLTSNTELVLWAVLLIPSTWGI